MDRSGVTLAFFNNGQVIRNFKLIVGINMAKADAGNTYLWIVFRYTDAAFGIFSFEMDNWPNVLSIFKIEGAGFQWDIGMVDIPLVFEVGQTYHVKLELIGAKATLWIDGNLMTEADWSNQPVLPKDGQIALGGGGGELQFDNFVITGEEILGSGEYSVNSKDKLSASWGDIKSAQ